MIIEVNIKVIDIEFIDGSRATFINKVSSHMFANNRTVFPFNKRIVGTLPRSAFCLFNQESRQYSFHHLINIFAAIVRMKVDDDKRKHREEHFKQGLHIFISNLRYATNQLPL